MFDHISFYIDHFYKSMMLLLFYISQVMIVLFVLFSQNTNIPVSKHIIVSLGDIIQVLTLTWP